MDVRETVTRVAQRVPPRARPLLLLVPLALVLLVVLLLARGGGGDDGEAQRAFAAKADAICARTGRELDALDTPRGEKGAKAFAEKARAISDRQLRDLRGLDAPDDVAGLYDEALDTLEQQSELLEELVEGDDLKRGAQLTKRLERLDTKASDLARRVGLRRCGIADA